ncbi:MAG: N,N-dimethylformamidase beta subunit family domain-containing protein [Gaiellaceae bacterium]
MRENLRTGSGGWISPDAVNHGIEGYASTLSVLPGESVPLHVATDPAVPYRITVYRLGWYGGAGGRLVQCVPSDCVSFVQGSAQAIPPPDPSTGVVRAGWPVTDTIRTGPGWESGYYLAKFTPQDGRQPNGILFVVREPPANASSILVIASVNTWEAYNYWGGKSLYDFSSDGRVPANHVSFDRPWSPGSQWQFFAWGVHAVRFLERSGYDVSYATDLDVDRDPSLLLRHTLIVVAGHGEYWTGRERDAFEAARDAGVNLMFLGANIGYWQVRYEDDRHTIVSYKSPADPIADPAQKTLLFRALTPPRYECALEGVMHTGSIERPGTPPADYNVNPQALSDPWFDGTGFTSTSVLPGLVAPEWDQVVDPHKAYSCWFPNLTVFFHHEGPPGNADAVRYIAKSGAMVFSSGSLGFQWGLDNFPPNRAAPTADPRLQRFLQNALDDMTQGPVSAWLPGPSWTG